MVGEEEFDSFKVPASAGSAKRSELDVTPGTIDFPRGVLLELSLGSQRTVVGAILH